MLLPFLFLHHKKPLKSSTFRNPSVWSSFKCFRLTLLFLKPVATSSGFLYFWVFARCSTKCWNPYSKPLANNALSQKSWYKESETVDISAGLSMKSPQNNQITINECRWFVNFGESYALMRRYLSVLKQLQALLQITILLLHYVAFALCSCWKQHCSNEEVFNWKFSALLKMLS